MSADKKQLAELTQFLSECQLFTGLNLRQLQKIGRLLEQVNCAAKERIISQGGPGDCLYIVQRGQLNIVAQNEDREELHLSSASVGETVGEIALLTGARRTASAYAIEPTRLLRLTKDHFDELKQNHQETAAQISQNIVQKQYQVLLDMTLRVSSLLENIDESVLQDLLDLLEITLLPSSKILVREGEESDSLYIVINGRLRVVRYQEDGSENALLELGRGETVGEVGLITGEKRSATVYAVRDTVLARLSKAAFNQLSAKHPQAMMQQFAATVITRMQGQIRGTVRATKHVANLAFVPLSSDVPLKSLLKTLTEQLGQRDPALYLDSVALADALNQDDIAQIKSDDPANINIVSWLAEQETQYRYIIYEADDSFSSWTQRCLRQADHIILVANANTSPSLTAIENEIANFRTSQNPEALSLVLLHPPNTVQPKGTTHWLAPRQVGHHYHIKQDSAADIARLARLLTGQGIGLVLSGGGARGYAHIGAYRALREAGIPIDLIGGTSQGGFMACEFAMGWDIDTIMAHNKASLKHKFDYTFPITALMAGGEMSDIVQEIFGDIALEDMWLPCFCTTTNLSTAKLIIHTQGPAWKYTRATTSLPGVLPPVMDEGNMLIDGGLLNNLPIDIMRQRSDVGVVFASDVSAPGRGSQASKAPYETRLSGWQVLWRRLNPFAKPMKIPSMGEIMMQIAVLSNRQTSSETRNLADFYMRLPVKGHGMLDFEALEVIVSKGYEAAQEHVALWEDTEPFQLLCATSKSINGHKQERRRRVLPTNTKSAEAPMVKGLPVLGVTLEAVRDVTGLLVRAYHEHGPVFRMSRLGKEVVVLAGVEANNFYVEHEESYFYTQDVYKHLCAEGGTAYNFIALEGDAHSNLRQQMRLGYSRQLIADKVLPMLDYVEQTARSWQPGQTMDVLEMMSNLLMEQAGTSLLNHSLAEDDFEKLNLFCKTFVGVGVDIQPPVLLRRPAYQRSKRRFIEVMDGAFAQHSSPPGEHRSLDQIDVALSARYPDGEFLDDRDAKGSTYFTYIMNSAYTNRACANLLYELLKNPDLLARVTAEVDAAVSSPDFNLTTLRRMPVLAAAIKEALRMYPIAVGQPRHARRDFNFGGYKIHHGQKVYIATTVPHFLPELFPNPYEFDPDRFLPPRNEHRQPRALVPFGTGKHACFGSSLANVLIMTTMMGLLRTAEFEIEPDTYIVKRVANPMPGPEGFRVRVKGHRPETPTVGNAQVLTDADLALLQATVEIDKEQLAMLVARAERRVGSPGEIIIQQGDEADAFYILAAGTVDVFLEADEREPRLMAQLTAGMFFGEIGLLQGVQRTATVKVSETAKAELIVISRDVFTEFVAEFDLTDAEIAALIRQRMISLNLAKALPNLNKEKLTAIAPNVEIQQYPPGAVIIQQGEPADKFYILTRGRAEVLNHHPSGHDITIDWRESGEYFGEIGLLQNRPRTATVRAAQEGEAEVVVMGEEAFLALLGNSEATEMDIARTIAQRLVNLQV